MDYSKVMIATPMRGGVVQTQYCVGLMHCSGLYGAWVPLRGQSDIYVARNTLANAFMMDDRFEALIFIDSDIGFTREDFKRLVDSTEPLVSGLYTDRQQPPQPFCRDADGELVKLQDIPPQGMVQSKFLPGGFLKIERKVFEAIVSQELVPSYHHGKEHQFYNGRIWQEKLLSEDYSFSLLAAEAGYTPWIDCGIRLEHDGRMFGC